MRILSTAPIYENYGLGTEVLVASVRDPVQVVQSALVGAHCATMPLKVMLEQLFHPLTDVGLAKFLEDNARAAARRR